MRGNTFTIKENTIGQVRSKIIYRNSLYFACLTLFVFFALQDNLNAIGGKAENNGSFCFVMLIGMIIFYTSCFFEIRLVNKNGEYVFPKAQWLFFYGKAVVFIVAMSSMIIALKFIESNKLKYLLLGLFELLSIATFYIIVMQAFKKKKLEEKIYIDYRLEKLKNAVSLRKFVIGIIISSVMLIGSVVMLSLSINSNASGGELGEHISDFVLTTLIAITLVIFYVVSAIKYQKNMSKGKTE